MENSNYGRKKEIIEEHPTPESGSTSLDLIDYEEIFRDSPDAFIIISLENGKIIEANNGATTLLGYIKEEISNLAVKDIFSEEEYDKLRSKYLNDSVSFNETFLDSEFTTRDQKRIPVTVSVKKINDGNRFLLIARDISGVKQTEEALRREAFIFENLNDAVLITDLKGYIQSWNKAAEKIFGYKKDEVVDSFVNILFKQSEFDLYFGKIRNTIEQTLHWNGETGITRKDGNEGIAETSVFPFRDSSGEHIAYVVIVKDVTLRKRAERLMRERDLMYRSLIESSADAIYVLKEKKLLLVNSAWCRLFGYTKEEALDENFDIMNIIAPQSKELINKKYSKNVSEKPDASTYELKGITKNNILIDLEVKVSKILWNGEQVYQGIYRDITEKKKHEMELRESEEKFRKLAEKSLVGIYIIQDNVFKYVNPKFTEIFGYSAQELIDIKGPADLTHPDDKAKVNDNVASRLAGLTDSIAYSFRGLRKDKTINYVDVFGTRTRLGGKPAVIGTLVDITEKRKAEKALKESEEKYRKIIESANDAIVIADIETGNIIDINKQTEILTGHIKEELIGKSVLCLHPEEQREFYARLFNEAVVQNQQISPEDVFIRHKNGSIIPVEISNSRYTLNGRDIIQGIFRDLRERKKVEEEIRKLSRAVEQSPSAIVITDTEGRIEYVNPHFCKVTGYTVKEVTGENPRILKSGTTSDNEYKEMWKTISAGREWRGEFHNKKKSGDLYWEQASISPIRDDRGNITHYIAIKEDITDKKRMQEELLVAKEKAEESDRMKSEFLSQMSHEIRTPLNVILSYNSFLKEELSETINEDISLSFNSIDSAGKRLLRTIDMILNLAAIQKGKIDISFDPVDLSDILTVLSKEFEFHARKKKLYLNLRLPSGKIMIPADEYLLGEIFQNLLNNAIKYTNQGGIEIELFTPDDKEVRVDIRDTGIGISEKYLPKLFLPFTQEETGYTRKFEGNGLGLALVKSYLDLLDAEIKVTSEKNRGTTFSIIFNQDNHAS
jgi:PAS domain S-box-containing protein